MSAGNFLFCKVFLEKWKTKIKQILWIDNLILLSSQAAEIKILVKPDFSQKVSQNPAFIWASRHCPHYSICQIPAETHLYDPEGIQLNKQRGSQHRGTVEVLRWRGLLFPHVSLQRGLSPCMLLIQQCWKGIWDSLDAKSFQSFWNK